MVVIQIHGFMEILIHLNEDRVEEIKTNAAHCENISKRLLKDGDTDLFFHSKQEIQLILLPDKKSAYRGFFLSKLCVRRDQN